MDGPGSSQEVTVQGDESAIARSDRGVNLELMSETDPRANDAAQDTLIINEVQLLLSEKRTSLSTLRTGIAIFAFPLSVLSLLIATSRAYDLKQVLHFL